MNAALHFRRVDWPVFLVLSLLPIQWINVIALGSLNLKPMHLGVLLLAMVSIVNQRQLKRGYSILVGTLMFWAPLMLYIFWSAFVTFTVTADGSMGAFSRLGMYFLIWVLIASRLAILEGGLRSTLYFSGIGALLFFLLAAAISAAQAGLSLLEGFVALTQGNYEVFAWHFVGGIFNAFAGDEYQRLTIKNSMAGMLLVCSLAFLSAAHVHGASWRFRAFNVGVALLYALLLPLLLSRSVLASAGLAIALFGLIQTRRSGAQLLIKTGIVVFPLALLLAAYGGDRIWEVIHALLLERDSSIDARLGQYEAASAMIERSPWIGRGVGIVVGDNVIHNLFLAAWAQSGLPGFLLAIGMYVGLLLSWINMSRMALRLEVADAWSVYAPWLITIPVLPLFRVWIGGDGGNIDPSGWLGLAVFHGATFALQNAVRDASAVEPIRRAK